MKAEVFNGETGLTCGFEEYDPERRVMTNCGKPGYGKIKNTVLCYEHFEYARRNLNLGKEDTRRVEAPA